MCECLEYEDGEMHLCVVCACQWKALHSENERLREALRDIERLYDSEMPVIELSRRVYDASCIARAALAEVGK